MKSSGVSRGDGLSVTVYTRTAPEPESNQTCLWSRSISHLPTADDGRTCAMSGAMLYATLTGIYLAIGGGFLVVSLLVSAGSVPGGRSENALTVFAFSTVAWPLVVYWVVRSA